MNTVTINGRQYNLEGVPDCKHESYLVTSRKANWIMMQNNRQPDLFFVMNQTGHHIAWMRKHGNEFRQDVMF